MRDDDQPLKITTTEDLPLQFAAQGTVYLEHRGDGRVFCSWPDGTFVEVVQASEAQRLRDWLGALANLRRIVGFVNDDMTEELARKALRGELLPSSLKLYAAPDRQR